MSDKNNISITEIRELSALPLDKLLCEIKNCEGIKRINTALAACVNACKRALGLDPFDEQIMAAYAIYNEKIVQMATGEGKTISAVFAAFLLKNSGRKIHILTFNDYLAERDYNWMKPIYDLLCMKIGFITSDTDFNGRKEAYACDVVYSTAKECGFDYLRDFIVHKEEDILLSRLDAVIVDEADSIMIDEARIPLVIAGSFKAEKKKDLPRVLRFINTLGEDDYKIYEENKSVYLTESGTEKAEDFFNEIDLYSPENADIMTLIYNSLKARFYLREDNNYIVRDGKILIIDEFTGRVAKNRHYPDILQSALETLHGLEISSRGTVMGTIPLQYFIREYDFIAGMTGTATSAAEEFELLYGLMTEEIPTHLPSKRADRDISVYFDHETKWKAIIDEILKCNRKGQPLLIGTSGIDESLSLAMRLDKFSINSQVLNAKSDHMEAEIIKNAGSLGAVTISTNMAGRGVDILLGGADGKTRAEVIEAGGLHVISTAMRESSRINNQLRGRAGRQGDIGESSTFVSLEDDIMLKYGLKKLIPKSRYPSYTEAAITDKVVLREVARIQRISEGDMLDCRKDLLKYMAITEKHRNAIFETRFKYLRGELKPNIWQERALEDYNKAVRLFGEKKTDELELRLILTVINEVWSAYLEFTDELRSGIHLTSVGGKVPIEEYNISSEEYYREMEENVIENMLFHLEKLLEVKDIDSYPIEQPLEIWTYLSDERVEDLVKKPFLTNVMTTDEEDDKSGQAHTAQDKKPSFFSRFFNKKES